MLVCTKSSDIHIFTILAKSVVSHFYYVWNTADSQMTKIVNE